MEVKESKISVRRTEPNHAKYETETIDISTKEPDPRMSCESTNARARFIIYPFRMRFINLTGDLVDRLGESLHIARGDSGNGDTAVLGGIDGVLGEPLAAIINGCVEELFTSLARASICSGFRPV